MFYVNNNSCIFATVIKALRQREARKSPLCTGTMSCLYVISTVMCTGTMSCLYVISTVMSTETMSCLYIISTVMCRKCLQYVIFFVFGAGPVARPCWRMFTTCYQTSPSDWVNVSLLLKSYKVTQKRVRHTLNSYNSKTILDI